ncbi:putative siderophore biosynthesis protein SbnA [Colletotrichum tanaceti]|nr:putative siderophore biosynthesis protein SbnA [Colletotrichum tanaceti]
MDPLNVFRGPASVANYYNPENSPPLPLVEIPDRLNPFRRDGVRIYAKLLTALPAQNVKSLPALGMLLAQTNAADKSIVEASSGSTVLSLGILSRVLWGNESVTAFVTNKKHPDSLKLLRFFGLKVSLYGGLAQQEPTDPRGIMQRLREKAAQDGRVCYPGQYDNENNWKSHERWTGPQILCQLPEIKVFCTTVGTGGCITGTGKYLKSQNPSIQVVGVFNVFGDPTPGPRHFYGFHTCGFPWKGTVDAQQEVSSADAYRMSMRLSREGIIAGPSSGEALQGLLDYIAEAKSGGKLQSLADDATGEVSCVFTCSDLPYQYLDGYFQKLAKEEFSPIENEDRHDERWILDPRRAADMLSTRRMSNARKEDEAYDTQLSEKSVPVQRRTSRVKSIRKAGFTGWIKTCFKGVESRQKRNSLQEPKDDESLVVLDLRSAQEFSNRHVEGAHRVSLDALCPGAAAGIDLFGDADAVHRVWTNLQMLFKDGPVVGVLERAKSRGVPVLVLCYNGEVSRLATSMLRGKGVEAFSVGGGADELWKALDGKE